MFTTRTRISVKSDHVFLQLHPAVVMLLRLLSDSLELGNFIVTGSFLPHHLRRETLLHHQMFFNVTAATISSGDISIASQKVAVSY